MSILNYSKIMVLKNKHFMQLGTWTNENLSQIRFAPINPGLKLNAINCFSDVHNK